MRKVLLPVDGSEPAFEAVLHLIGRAREEGRPEVHVLAVEPQPLAWQTRGMASEAIGDHLTARAHLAMQPALHALNEAGIPNRAHVRFGDTAETIAALAEELGCDTIVMGTHGRSALAGLALGSVTSRVIHLAKTPVLCVKSGR